MLLLSVIKIVLFVAVIALATLGAGFLLESEGGIQVTVAGTEFTLGPLQSVIALVLFVVAVWLAFKLLGLLIATLRFLNGDETAISRYFDRNRERKGLDALSEGMIALASGDGREALAKAQRADKYLRQPRLTNVLTAQAAEMTGDEKKAAQVYRALLQDDATRFVGVRGIMKQKLAAGDTETALKLAEKAFALKPRHEEVQDTLLKLQANRKDWDGARKTLNAKLKHGTLPRDVHRRRDAVLALSQAKTVIDDGADIEAREAAIEANRLSPDLVPAAVMAARGYIETGNKRYAARVLHKAWENQPHPDLAAAFAEIEPGEDPQARIKRFSKLVRPNPSHPESRMLMAELHIAAEDFPGARRALGAQVEDDPTARALTIMAAIERGEGAADDVVKGWLARAVNAPRGPAWVCENCNTVHGDWAPVCDHCGAFDTLAWTAPAAGDMPKPTGVEMLPLIVGSGSGAKSAVVPVEDESDIADAEVIDGGEDETGKPA